MDEEIKDVVGRAKESGSEGIKAKEWLYVRYSKMIYNLCLKLLEDKAEAEDATVQVFLQAFEKLAYLKEPGFFGTWLYRIAINVSKNILKSKRKKEVPIEDYIDKLVVEESDKTEEDSKTRIEKALKKLNSVPKELIILREYENKSYEEISRILGINIGTVRSRLSRAREELRDMVIKNEDK